MGAEGAVSLLSSPISLLLSLFSYMATGEVAVHLLHPQGKVETLTNTDYRALVLEFVCPTCGAGVGQLCVRQRSRLGSPPYHKTRGRLVQRARR
jgi:hypothetical protein